MSYSPNDNNIKNNINNIKGNNNNNFSGNNKKNKITKIKGEYKTKKDNKTKKIEESEKTEQDQKKNEYIDALVKNGVLNVTKELNIIKKLTHKEIMNRKKKEFLQENGFDENNIDNNDKQIRYNQPQLKINNVSFKSIRKKNISMKNANYVKNKVNKLNISKSNSKYVSFLHNNETMRNLRSKLLNLRS
jgi:hypothetical protein